MPEQIEWWRDRKYWELFNGWSEVYDIPAIIAEAQRREREAVKSIHCGCLDKYIEEWGKGI